MIKRLCLIVMVCVSAAAFGANFGLVLGAEGEYARALSPDGLSLAGTASPWFSMALSETAGLYASGKITVLYEEKRNLP
jgi:hypothetical protein